MSGFSSSTHSYHSAVGGEAEDAASVCASTIAVKEAAVAHGAEGTVVPHKPDSHDGTPDKSHPPVPGKPKPHYQEKDLLCDKVQCKAKAT